MTGFHRKFAATDRAGPCPQAAPTAPSWPEFRRFIAVMVLFWSSLYMFVPVMTPLAAQRGASMRLVGMIVSSYGLVLFLSRIPLGIWSDRTHARRAFVGYGFVAVAAGALGMALIENPEVMVFMRGLSGIAAAMWVMLTVLFASCYSLDRLPYAMGIAIMCSYLSQTVATLLGGVVADRFGWEAPFFLSTLLAVAGFFLVRSLRDTSAPATTPSLREMAAVAANPAVLGASLLAALILAVQLMTVHGFTPLLATEFGAGGTELGVLAFAATATMAAGSYVGGRWIASRIGPAATVTFAFTVTAVFTLWLSTGTTLSSVIIVQAVAATGIGVALPPLTSLALEAVAPELRATAMALFQALYSLGIFGGPLLAGMLAETHGIPAAITGAAAVATSGALISIPTIRRGLRSSTLEAAAE